MRTLLATSGLPLASIAGRFSICRRYGHDGVLWVADVGGSGACTYGDSPGYLLLFLLMVDRG